MPNWCMNILKVEGDAETVERFKTQAVDDSEYLAMEKFHPTPPSLLKVSTSETRYNWCEWRIKHWGTKWDLCEVEVFDESSNQINYQFLSANSPPIAWLKRTAKAFPSLTFTLNYEDVGGEYEGNLIVEKNKVTEFELPEPLMSPEIYD